MLCDVDGRWLTGGDLDERTASAAGALIGAGLRAGDRLLLCAGPSAAFVVAYVAALRAGVVVVPVNPGYTRGEVERIVRASGPRLAVVEDGERAGWVREAAGVPVLGLELSHGHVTAEVSLDVAAPGDPALLMYTSGTTGAPKGALLRHGNLLAGARAVVDAWRWTPEDRLLLTLPLFHMHGLGVGVNGSLVAGAQIVLRPGFDPGDVAAHCREGGVTMFFGVPTIYARLAERGGPQAALSGLRLLVSGSAPLPVALSEAIARATGQVPLERYGMTETVMLTSNPLDGPRKPGKVGLPLPGVQLRLADADGEVQVCGPSVIAGYDRRPDADAEAFTSDGWFRTGDLGRLDEDGHLELVGRSKELIISGGFNVYPREVEEALSSFPGVGEVAVVGRPDERWGEAVTAVVVSSPDGPEVDPAALRAFAAERLAAYKVPKAVEFVEALPRNALGKLVRGEL